MTQLIDRTVEAFRRSRQFVLHDAWHIGAPGEKPPDGFLIKHVRVAILLVQNFAKNALLLRASALAFASVLAIVPFLAITFFTIESFSLDTVLYEYVADALGVAATQDATQPATTQAPMTRDQFKQQVAQFFLRIYDENQEGTEHDQTNPVKAIVELAKQGENPQSVKLAGLILIITTVFGLLMNIESAFNQIWGLKNDRSWYRMFSDYLVMVLAMPFFVATTVTFMFILSHSALNLPLSQKLIYRLAQHVAIWLSFAALYYFVPNTRVRLRYALLGGLVAGTAWSFLTWFYIAFQYGLNKYSLLYSTFAQFPVLLMWVYFSWVIVLFGAELTFAYQNEKIFALERYADKASYAYREALGLRTMIDIARRFEWGIVGLAAEEAAREWNVPLRLLNALLDEFARVRLVMGSTGDPVRYVPGRPLDKITVGDVISTLREAGHEPTALRADESFRPFLDRLRSPRDGFLEVTLSELTEVGAPPRQVDWPAPAEAQDPSSN